MSQFSPLLTKQGVRDFFRFKSTRRVDELRRNDPDFPKPKLIGPATARWRLDDLVAYVDSRPEGWCVTGGRREGAFKPKDTTAA